MFHALTAQILLSFKLLPRVLLVQWPLQAPALQATLLSNLPSSRLLPKKTCPIPSVSWHRSYRVSTRCRVWQRKTAVTSWSWNGHGNTETLIPTLTSQWMWVNSDHVTFVVVDLSFVSPMYLFPSIYYRKAHCKLPPCRNDPPSVNRDSINQSISQISIVPISPA